MLESVPTTAETGEWADIGYAENRLGFKTPVILRLVREGVIPAIQLAGTERTTTRLLRRFIDEAYATVVSGGVVELREFARQWAERNAEPEVA